MFTGQLSSQLERFLQTTGKRELVIASNMANVDTPGYRTQDINFHQALQNASAGNGAGSASVKATAVPGLLERPDGNNVDLDRESMLMAESQLSYQAGTQLLKSRFHQLLSAINGTGTGD